jgi:hypothetical protein
MVIRNACSLYVTLIVVSDSLWWNCLYGFLCNPNGFLNCEFVVWRGWFTPTFSHSNRKVTEGDWLCFLGDSLETCRYRQRCVSEMRTSGHFPICGYQVSLSFIQVNFFTKLQRLVFAFRVERKAGKTQPKYLVSLKNMCSSKYLQVWGFLK